MSSCRCKWWRRRLPIGAPEVNHIGLRLAHFLPLQRTVGNRGVQRIMARGSANANDTQQEQVTQNTSGLVLQRNGDKPATVTPPGRGISTAFGTYWIVPDLTDQSYQVEGEQITESDFAKLEKLGTLCSQEPARFRLEKRMT